VFCGEKSALRDWLLPFSSTLFRPTQPREQDQLSQEIKRSRFGRYTIDLDAARAVVLVSRASNHLETCEQVLSRDLSSAANTPHQDRHTHRFDFLHRPSNTMPTQRPFFANFFAAFRVHSALKTSSSASAELQYSSTPTQTCFSSFHNPRHMSEKFCPNSIILLKRL